VFKFVLEIKTPVLLTFAASEMGMWPPPRMANFVWVATNVLTAKESEVAHVGANTHAGPSQAEESQDTGLSSTYYHLLSCRFDLP
jgi:hypothetical protein